MTRSSPALLVALALAVPAAAAPPKDLLRSPDQQRLKEVKEAIESADEFTDRAKTRKVVAASIVLYKDRATPTDKTESEFAESLHFNYADGTTIRTVYNLTARKAVKVESLEAYPTPLADEEVATARQLAEQKDKQVKDLVAATPANELTVTTLAPVVSERKNPNFGKRLAVLVYTPKGKPADSQKVTVNLTDSTVTRDAPPARR